jgi:hypothetical protein
VVESTGPVQHFAVVFIVCLGFLVERCQMSLGLLFLHHERAVVFGQVNFLFHHQMNHLLKELRHLCETTRTGGPLMEVTDGSIPLALLDDGSSHRWLSFGKKH